MLADLAAFLPFALPLLLAGAGAGLIAGLLGVGGGIVVVPALFLAFGHLEVAEAVRMKMAVGTSLATIVATAWSSARAHWQRGTVDRAFLRAYGPAIALGAWLGTLMVSSVRGPVLSGLFGVLALAIAAQIAFGNPSRRLGDRPPEGPARIAIGGAIGGLSGMIGIGGGAFAVPVMSLYGFPMHRAVGTAAAVGFLIGVPGMLGFVLGGWDAPDLPPFSLGYVSLAGLVLIAPASVLCAPLGARLAHRLDTGPLRKVFAFFLGLTALRMLAAVFA